MSASFALRVRLGGEMGRKGGRKVVRSRVFRARVRLAEVNLLERDDSGASVWVYV